jgi:hypothetical protein
MSVAIGLAARVERVSVTRIHALPKPLSRVRFLLRYLRYDPADVAAIVDQLGRRGTTQGCPLIDPSDRPAVEFILSRPDV